jgi:enoyl-CoA hydratase
MGYENLIVERDGRVARIVFNRPSVLNALSRATMAELDATIDELAADDAVGALILTGAGDKAFVAGADIGEFNLLSSASDAAAFARRGQAVLAKLEALPKPVIAAINGFALGGGCELAMACDIRLAADTARLGQPEINLGIIPGYAGTQRLSRLVGRDRAMELVLTGRHVSAAEALSMGLVTRVVPAASLMDEALAFATELASKAPLAVRYAMEAINRGVDMPFEQACAYEAALFGLATATADMREGTRAFLDKRKPTFTGR